MASPRNGVVHHPVSWLKAIFTLSVTVLPRWPVNSVEVEAGAGMSGSGCKRPRRTRPLAVVAAVGEVGRPARRVEAPVAARRILRESLGEGSPLARAIPAGAQPPWGPVESQRRARRAAAGTRCFRIRNPAVVFRTTGSEIAAGP